MSSCDRYAKILSGFGYQASSFVGIILSRLQTFLGKAGGKTDRTTAHTASLTSALFTGRSPSILAATLAATSGTRRRSRG